MTNPQPTRWSGHIFTAKAIGLRLRRAVENLHSPVVIHTSGSSDRLAIVAGETRTPLYSAEADPAYELGKIQNLRVAASRLNGVHIPAGALFSFWRQIGRPSRRNGFVVGRMLKEGCIVPSIGGGLCQLSNALYQTALAANCEIVERHAHSRIVPGSAASEGTDATVAWNYVDLRFRPRVEMQLVVELSRDELIVRFRARAVRKDAALLPMFSAQRAIANDCVSCGQSQCFQHHKAARVLSGGYRTAYLVDENWPEFRNYIVGARQPNDALFIPLNGARWRVDRYAWPTAGFAEVHEARLATLARSWRSRRLAAQGAARQLALFESAEALAKSYAARIPHSANHVVVAQSLLPFLWRSGQLGGRTFSVLATRMPICSIERELDASARQHPDRATLSDFRAPDWIAAAENEALVVAESIVTPHAAIADTFGARAQRIDWIGPKPARIAPAPEQLVIGFAGPVAARRGAYEVREAAREIGASVVYTGANLEGANFWDGVAARRAGPGWDWLSEISVLAAPSIVESRPNAALAAQHLGVPVIATAPCGLLEGKGVTIINTPLSLTEYLIKSPQCASLSRSPSPCPSLPN